MGKVNCFVTVSRGSMTQTMVKSAQPVDLDPDQITVMNFVADVGSRVRAARTEKDLSRRELSELSGISERYLAQLESGAGNISVALLFKVAIALEKKPDWFLTDHSDEGLSEVISDYRSANKIVREKVREMLSAATASSRKGERICLIGLRGAGKSTLGRMLADELDFGFVELNKLIEAQSGMPVSEVMALYGGEGYRQLEMKAIDNLAEQEENMVLAVGGGIVSEMETFGKILSSFHSVWLKAQPEEHMERVRDQGDYRPMAGNPNAMEELKSILTSREARYSRADVTVDTSGRSIEDSLHALQDAVRELILNE
ncbi:MAG: helix-turn-helix transcriptional regulator [Pseudomonadota bacterium]